MAKTHPSRWKIRHDPNNNRMLCLPLGGKEYVSIGTKSYGAIWRFWAGQAKKGMKTYTAGDFAEILRELNKLEVELYDIKFVSEAAAGRIPHWLRSYEVLVMKYNQEVNAEQRHEKPAKPPVVVDEPKPTERLAVAELRLELAKEALNALIIKHDSDLIDKGKLASKAYEYAEEMITRFENYL